MGPSAREPAGTPKAMQPIMGPEGAKKPDAEADPAKSPDGMQAVYQPSAKSPDGMQAVYQPSSESEAQPPPRAMQPIMGPSSEDAGDPPQAMQPVMGPSSEGKRTTPKAMQPIMGPGKATVESDEKSSK